MKFVHPEFLYYMLPPLIVLFGLLLTQKEPQASYFSEEVMQRLRVVANTLSLKARNALFFLAAIFMIIALAEPVIVDGKTQIEQRSADILIALDISNSMLAEDVYPNRIELAKKKAIEFIRMLKQDRVGVVAFASGAYLVSPLSFDHEAVAFLLKNLKTSSITEQGTDFNTLLKTIESSAPHAKEKYVLLLSDGGDQKDFSSAIAYAKKHAITVFVLAVGSKRGAPIKMPKGGFMKYKGEIVITRLNDAIADLATQTGGVYIEATASRKDIEAMYKEMQSVVKKKRAKAKAIEHRIPLFYFPLGVAMLLLLIALSSMSKRTNVALPSLLLLPLLLFGTPSLKAGILDFASLKEAKEAYKQGNYKEAARKFEAYAKRTNKAQAYYDAANAYYKAKQYQKAIELYKKVRTKDANLMARSFYNLGNAYVQSHQYQEAIEAYKDALKLQKDQETLENLEVAKRLLERQRRKKAQKSNEKNNRPKQKSSSQSSQKQQQGSGKKQNQDVKNSKQKSDMQSQSQQAKSSKEHSENTKESQKQKEKKKNQHNPSHKGTLKELSNQQKKEHTQVARKKAQMMHKEKQMSDAEEKKWLQELNKETQTFIYMMHPPKDKGYENEDQKPW